MTQQWSFQRISAVVALLFAVALKPVIVPRILKANLAPADKSIGSLPLLSAAELRNHFDGKSALVIGGTRGVGYGTAVALARAGASVTVVGRSEGSGRAAVDGIRAAIATTSSSEESKQQSLEFLRGDLGTVRSTMALVDTLTSRPDRYDILVVSAASFPDWSGSLLNEDGIDKSFAIAVVGRYLVYRNMHKFLNFDGGTEPPRVLNVMIGGTKPINSLDRSLASGKRNSTNLFENIMCWCLANDIMLIGLEERDANARRTTRVTIHPGMLKTDLHRGQGLWFDALEAALVTLAGISEEDCGLRQASTLASDRLRVGGLSYIDMFGMGRARSSELQAQVDEHLIWLMDFLDDLEPKR